ncbi:pentatricopeptide repeat-containing protein At5g39680-like [Actinidia eriantha]|uniref:pentatricopeptide repeat-containing protein At5g39680-like n=1 Tax=Actinidia eriantha TaxID=165200 RepID=UPI00258F9AD4|nr:pentatricopeptide repeat-containing protein At5g39680-like [Actinidia eriantha]
MKMRKFPPNPQLQTAVQLRRASHQRHAFSIQTESSMSSLDDTVKLLKISADTKNLGFGKIIHALLIVTNQATPDHVIQTNSLINLYSKCGQIKIARQLFDEMRERNVVSWSGLMAGYLHNGFPLEVLRLFKTMALVDDFRPNEYVLATVLSSCSDCGSILEGMQCHGHVLKSGLVFHQYVKNALTYMYTTCSDVEGAMKVLNSVPGSDVYTFNSIIKGLVEHGYLTEALEVLGRMTKECVTWDSVTYVSVFGLCTGLKDLKLGLQVHNQIVKTNVEFDEFVGSAVIDMYGKCGETSIARNVFDGLQSHNVVLWTAILAAYLQNGCFEEALKLFFHMELEGVKPNEYTFAVLLNSCAGLSALGHGNSVHAQAEKSGLKQYIIVGNALINMYAKSGNIEAANKVFTDMVYRDSITWNAIISGYAHHGLGKEALIIFQDMLAAEETPNYVTFVGVLSACAHLGWVREGFYYLHQLMNQLGIEPGLEHYTCIVGLLCRAGLLEQAKNFMRSNPVKWDVVAWRTLLSACHVHRNYRLGKHVAEIVLRMDPEDVGTYILLSNMHAKANRWDGVVRIRKLMRERIVKKEPGVSWIEIRNHTHVFVSDDNKHPEFSQIYEKVRELLADIKPLGYAPNIAAVLHDVEEEQKEDYLSYHSEKLAIAYSLIKTPSEAPIRVIKNLRMCDDCHSAVKLISKVTNRVIIVRDVNRFHCFRDGCCSCGGYW